MKLINLLLLVSIFNAFGSKSYSQNTRLNLDMKDVPISDVLKAVENRSEFFFLYSSKMIDVNQKVDVHAVDQPITTILDSVLSNTDIKYVVKDKQILLVNKEINSVTLMQQNKLSGIVTDDKNGAPLAGVTVMVEGTNKGTFTDKDGKYQIETPSMEATLSFSFIGYNSVKEPIAGRSIINITMSINVQALEEVVVIGYGTVKKSDLTGSVASVSSDKLVAFPTYSVVQSLTGKVAGLSITSNNGAPGSGSTIRIRGGSSISTGSEPLWVVDGFPGAPVPQSEDIQSIEVLRDASACAIYGSRGANGVILVTTKKGTSGDLKVEANTSYSFNTLATKYNLLNAHEYAQFVNDYTVNKNPAALPVFNPDTIGAGTDWQNVIFRTGGTQTYQASVAGGSDKLKLYSSAKYSKIDGIVINSSSDFFTGKLNVDANVSDKTMVGVHVDYGHWTNNNIASQEVFTGYDGVVGTALGFEPTLGIYKADGITYTTAQRSFGSVSDNPYACAVEQKNQRVSDNVSTNMYLDWELLRGLKLYTSVALQLGSSRTGNYIPKKLVANMNTEIASLNTDRNINLVSTVYLTYDKTLADIHRLTLMIGHDYQSNNYEYFSAGSRYLPDDSYIFWNLGSGTQARFPTSGTNLWKLESIYGRLNYALKDRYLLTFTAREDGSSRFGVNNKWAFFPSVAARWNVKQESFMQSIDAISQLSVHAGVGSNGNTGLPAYSSLATLNASGIYAFFNGVRQNAAVPSSVANSKLAWEKSVMTNIGIELGLFKGRMNFSAEWYNRQSSGMLYQVPLATYTGYPNMWSNYGDYRNRGLEFTLGGNLSSGDFRWSSDFNISFNKSKVLKLPGGDVHGGNSPFNNDRPWILREGETTNAFYGYVYDGVFQVGDNFSAQPTAKPGYAKYRDINGRDASGNLTGEPDGTINTDDQKILGSANPDFTFGWTNNFTYKNFDLNLQITGMYGNKMINATRMEMETMSSLNNTTSAYFDAWTTTHTNTDVPLVGSASQFVYSSRWVEDASFLRVQNIALGYSLPSSFVNKLKISKCRIYVSVQNALILTKYSGSNPEVLWNPVNSTMNTNIYRGMEYDSYPTPRNYTMGINISF